jgi:pimeloyl-ACP methyl ester carboxylesterase
VAAPIPDGVEPFVTALRRRQTYLGYAREAVSLAQCIARYPFGMADRGVRAGRPSGDASHDAPVLLVHGFAHNHSGWFMINQHLRQAGFTSVHGWNYDPWRHGVPELAGQLRDRVELVRDTTGAERVHVVGHSLGGILLRWYVQELGGDDVVANAITVASPHAGTRLASLARRRTSGIGAELAPGSWLLRRLDHGAEPSAVRWTAFYSNLDFFVQPASSAMITNPALGATNVFVKDVGHLSILLSARVARGIVAAITAGDIERVAS